MAEILIIAYLVIGAMVSALIWAMLIVSKRHENKARQVKRERLESNLFREPNTKASRFRP